jgi:hypothetical protein
MGISSWWNKLTGRSDADLVEREEEREHETPDEQYLMQEDYAGRKADQAVARSMHEGNIGDAEAFARDDDGPAS